MNNQPPEGYPPQEPPWPDQRPDAFPPPGYPAAPQGYYSAMPGAYPGAQTDSRAGLAIASLVLGIFGLLGSLFLCGSPFAIAGLICGVLGQASTTRKTLALVGLVLSAIGLIISLVVIAFIIIAIVTQSGTTQPTTP